MPPKVLREVGTGYGSLFSIEARSGKIILEPKQLRDEELSREDWDALDKREFLLRVEVEFKLRQLLADLLQDFADESLGRF